MYKNWRNIKNVYRIEFESLKILILILIHRIRYVLCILAFLQFSYFEIQLFRLRIAVNPIFYFQFTQLRNKQLGFHALETTEGYLISVNLHDQRPSAITACFISSLGHGHVTVSIDNLIPNNKRVRIGHVRSKLKNYIKRQRK